MLLSLFCGIGGLDLGFENLGFGVGVAVDKNPDSVYSYNHNRAANPIGVIADIRKVNAAYLDQLFGARFNPVGVIGGPPCQSFTQANRSPVDNDPRHDLPLVYAALLEQLNERSPVHFFVFENVPGLCNDPHTQRFETILQAFGEAGFTVSNAVLNAVDYRVPQSRERLIIVGYNRHIYGELAWKHPAKARGRKLTVKSVIAGIPEPAIFRKDLKTEEIPYHRNHWCMAPKSKKFSARGALQAGMTSSRSFKTLSWDSPSITVAYGHREVHVHPECHRRLSVFEAMRLQGFPEKYELVGSLSSQIQQVSEAVPPPMAKAIAESIIQQLEAAGWPNPLVEKAARKPSVKATRISNQSAARR